jgi:uncharacterized protein YbaP (TraB family)
VPEHTLWRVQTNGEGGVAYLLGSLHLMRRDDTYPLPEVMQSAFASADVVAFELDLDAAREGAARMVERGLPGAPGRTVADALPDSTEQLLHTQLDSLGLSITPFLRMEPWLAGMVLPAAVLRESEYSAEAGLDRHFFEKAKAVGKERVALETLDEQIDVFDYLPIETQSRMLHAALRDVGRTRAQLRALTAAWAAGDTAALAGMTNLDLHRHPALRRRLLTDRNRRWVPQIERLLQRADTSLVVGTGHLVGEGSVVDLLRKKGYAVEQL